MSHNQGQCKNFLVKRSQHPHQSNYINTHQLPQILQGFLCPQIYGYYVIVRKYILLFLNNFIWNNQFISSLLQHKFHANKAPQQSLHIQSFTCNNFFSCFFSGSQLAHPMTRISLAIFIRMHNLFASQFYTLFPSYLGYQVLQEHALRPKFVLGFIFKFFKKTH